MSEAAREMMTAALEKIVAMFQGAEREMRAELLLDYARQLPALPERLRALQARDLGRVAECQTPVWLYVEAEDGRLRLCADVADEAPTVKGFVAILVEGLDGAMLEEAAEVPTDLVRRLGLEELIRMTREMGLGAIVWRVKREARRLAGIGGTPQAPV
jgi:cysteine desulfuration protein SufE